MTAASPGDCFAALFAAHEVGDYWFQTPHQALSKADSPAACARHAAVMTATKALALAALRVSGRRVSWKRATVALAADGLAHYAADRRQPLIALTDWLDRRVMPGKAEFWYLGSDSKCLGTGAHVMDQAFHIGCLYAASLIAAGTSE